MIISAENAEGETNWFLLTGLRWSVPSIVILGWIYKEWVYAEVGTKNRQVRIPKEWC